MTKSSQAVRCLQSLIVLFRFLRRRNVAAGVRQNRALREMRPCAHSRKGQATGAVLLVAIVLVFSAGAFAGVTASISGTVKDQSGAIVSGAAVTATNVDTGVATTQTTNSQGFYSFQELSL